MVKGFRFDKEANAGVRIEYVEKFIIKSNVLLLLMRNTKGRVMNPNDVEKMFSLRRRVSISSNFRTYSLYCK